ncbi:MAG: response regulator [Magnetospirillum sp.]|nr:response regulator [Magnetospirillum sp.]
MRSPNETTLMVVEDEYLVATSIEMVLQDAGYTVLEPISNIEDALETIGTSSADLALLDVNLSGHRVYPVADALLSRNVPFIFLTGCDEGDLPPRFAGTTLLVKPFSPQKLLHAITQTLGA